MHRLTRRSFALRAPLGLGALGFASAATGIPGWFLNAPLSAHAQRRITNPDRGEPQMLIFSTSGEGDPVNANAPGTYGIDGIIRSSDPAMAETELKLGDVTTRGAAPWATLPQAVLDRTCFIHHSCPSQIHPDHPDVLALINQAEENQGILELYARQLAPTLGTVLDTPVSTGAGPVLRARGQTVADTPPTVLRGLLAKPDGPLAALAQQRDATLDRMHALLAAEGTREQKDYLDSIALSRSQARNLSDDVLNILEEIVDDSEAGQILAAIAVLKLKLSPAVAIKLHFGGDNHADPDLAGEAVEYQSGVASVASLMARLETEGLGDKVTFAMLNVFGRSLAKKGLEGRDHWGHHHTTVVIGKQIRAGVYGGIDAFDDDFRALDINTQTGAGEVGGDLRSAESLFGVTKTLGQALGIDGATLDDNLKLGKAITAALS